MHRTTFTDCFMFCLFAAAFAGCFVLGYGYRKSISQDANDLLRAGFVIVDSDGFEIERFDGADYFTTSPK